MKKTALITGASSGIGRELARIFAAEGYNLVLIARREERLQELSRELQKTPGIKILIIAKDLSIPASPEEIFREIKDRNMHIDVLVNNAGSQVYGLFAETDWCRELNLIQTNLVSLTHLTKLFVTDMVKNGGGKILNVGSTGSFMPAPRNAIYCAAKAYVLNFSLGIAKDLEGTGITVTTLCPGATKTEFAGKANMENTLLFKMMVMDAVTVAKAGYKALIKGKEVVVPGIANKLTVLLARFLPRRVILGIGNIIMKPCNDHSPKPQMIGQR
ncbi:MAG: SDR family oxidoreductase [Deltaproteobacteria bacterium]|nr:SDR family oxidoreductase [Deltaproteobacteria bacterium]